MTIIIHGENITESRKKLVEIIEQLQETGVLVERLDAKKLDLPTLESKLQKTDLFGHSRAIIIEELHSLPRSKKLTQMVEMIVNSKMQICLWEKRDLTTTMLKKFPNAQLFYYKLANSLFAWLDSLSPSEQNKVSQLKLFKTAQKEHEEYLCFIMLIRQVRLLLQATNNDAIAGPSFMVKKLQSQAKQFTLGQLLKLHSQLHALDKKMKTSSNILSVTQEIEQLIINL